MRLGLIILLCMLNTGCALWRRDREEPVENGPRQEMVPSSPPISGPAAMPSPSAAS